MRMLAVWAALGLAARAYAQGIEEPLLSFGSANQAGQYPESPLVQGADGALYGTTSDGGAGTNGTVFRVGTNGLGYTVLHTFSSTGGDGRHPRAGLVRGSDGALYGTTSDGGSSDRGTVFKLNPDGSGYSVLHSFTGWPGDGSNPEAELIQGNDGAFYGTTRRGGAFRGTTRETLAGFGTVFKLNGDGSGYAVLYSFGGASNDGWSPQAALLQGRDGGLYGTTYFGGAYTNWGGTVYTNWGTVFTLQPDGTGYGVLYNFKGVQYDAVLPQSALMQGADGALYGTSYAGGYPGSGAIFKLNPDGSGYSVLFGFTGTGSTTGWQPHAGLIQSPDGTLYGTAYQGGANNYGTVFKIKTNGLSFATLHTFGTNICDGQCPPARLLQASDGALYGTTYMGGASAWGTIFKISTNGTGYVSLYSFASNDPLGQTPGGELVLGGDGTLYGKTSGGGAWGNGTVYRVGTDGTAINILYSFRVLGGDGQGPASLAAGADGALYGTTGYGGTNGGGTVFRITTNGASYDLLHHFSNNGIDGIRPYGRLVQGSDGAFYGTTSYGGTNGAGTAFKLNPNGTGYQVLHTFATNGVDGQNPLVGLLRAGDGALYGTTLNGGASGGGTIFKLSANGAEYAVLYHFTSGGTEGYYPGAAVTQASDGALYGTAIFGGTSGYGAIFRIGTNGNGYTLLCSFPNWLGRSRWYCNGPLAQDSDGMLYGATCYGGSNDVGSIFRLNTNGADFAVLHSFSTNASDGVNPSGGLIPGGDGAWYGTTSTGGSWGKGMMFRCGTPRSVLCRPGAPDGTFHFLLRSMPGLTYRIDASTNLVNWVPLGELPNPSGLAEFIDSGASNFPRRFYRAAWTPP